MGTEVARLHLLPVPNFCDEAVTEFSFKQNRTFGDTNRLRPPKLKRHHDSYLNRSNAQLNTSTIAHAISFRSESQLEISKLGDSEINSGDNNVSASEHVNNSLSSCYNPALSSTYFEQCFTQLAKLGEGSFGEVFKVCCKEDGNLYAVKMSKQLFRGELYRQERLEEVRRYEQFSDHENCVRFYRAWEQDDRLYMQMELCRESLEQHLQRRRHIPEPQIWSILLDLLLALKSLHDRNLIHLDIKLDNVLIGDDQSCKLADFGLVIDVNKANRHQATEGDSRYIAPEIMRGHFSKAADIFSLGIAMLELTCFLELPSNGLLWQKLRNGILPEEFFNNISDQLQSIIRQMMNPEPRLRPTVDEILAHKNLCALLRQRKRWALLKNLRWKVRKSYKSFWSTMCNFKDYIVRLVTQLCKNVRFYSKFKQKKPDICPLPNVSITAKPVPFSASTPCSWRLRYPDDAQESSISSDVFDDYISESCNISNPSPINSNVTHCSRSRKDLSKILPNVKEVYQTEGNGSGQRRGSFMSLDEAEKLHSLCWKQSGNVLHLRKRLFDTFED